MKKKKKKKATEQVSCLRGSESGDNPSIDHPIHTSRDHKVYFEVR